MKKIAWIDTIRVAAALMIIFAHYFMCGGFAQTMPYLNHALSYDTAITGVALFLAISGYLIPASLKRTPSLWKFYSRKFVRIVVPFTVSWFVMTAALLLPALFNETLYERVPLLDYLNGGSFCAMALSAFPVDLNVTKLLGQEVYWFVGEWFMGTILWLYLLSPLLNYFAERRPLESLAVSIVVSFAAYHLAQGAVYDAWTLFVVRIPEFLFGMILFHNRNLLKAFRVPLFLALSTGVAAVVMNFVASFPPQGALFFTSSPRSFLLTLPMIYLMFMLAELLNALLPEIFARLNSLNGESYIAMIIQHPVIYLFADTLRFENLNLPGSLLMVVAIIFVTFKAAQFIKKLSDPIERGIFK